MTQAPSPAAKVTPAYDTYMQTRHFGCLDGLRFLCISAVIWHHSTLSGEMLKYGVITTRGFLGVDFFFVLSGYLITTLLLREQRDNGQFDLRSFYWRRLLRIVPVYFFVVLSLASYFIFVQNDTELARLVPFYLLFLSNFLVDHIPMLTPTWSLSVEEQYYMIWPALLLLLPLRWIVPVVVALIALNVMVMAGALDFLGITAPRIGPLRIALPPATYAPILMGSLAAIALNNRIAFGRIAPFVSARLMPVLFFATLLVFLEVLPLDLKGMPNFLIHTLMCLILISLVVREDNGMRFILSNRFIARIGQISYGIYLYHLIMLVVAHKVLLMVGLRTEVNLFFAYYALSVLVAEISFRTLEAFFMRFRHSFQPKVKH